MGIYSRSELEEILNKYGDMIYRMAYAQVKKRDTADDIYQEVCMKLIKQKSSIEPEEHLKAWLLRTTINCCKDYWMSAWFQKISWTEEKKEEPVLDKQQNEGYITEYVQKLPKKYSSLIHLYYYEGYSQKEIADLLGMNENTVASRLARGRERLKKLLENGKGNHYEF